MSLPELQSFTNRSIGNPGDAASSASTASAHAKLNQILTNVPAGNFATQYGSINYASGSGPYTATISSVDLTKSVVMLTGWTQSNSTSNLNYAPIISLTNSTTVSININGAIAGGTATFVVLTFAQPVSSIQTGTINFAGNVASATATVSSVTTSKALLICTGYTIGSNDGRDIPTLTLTNSTTITAAHAQSGSIQNTAVGWALVAF